MNDDTIGEAPTEFPEEDSGSEFEPGDRLGQYRIVRLLGRGGMGQVYEVEHDVLQKRYALKILPQNLVRREGFLDRFKREARVMANLQHPHILPVGDFGEVEDRYFLRMELAKGLDAGKFGYEGRCTTSKEQVDETGREGIPVARELSLGRGVTMKLVLIPAGEFQMGSFLSPDEIAERYGGKARYYTDERPRHRVRSWTHFTWR